MVTFDFSDIDRMTRKLKAFEDQIPFALSKALNSSVDVAKKELVQDTWPSHVKVRNARFLGAALTTKGRRATKRNLRAELYDQYGRGMFSEQETGGTKRGHGGDLAIPVEALQGKRNSKGMPAGLRPRNLQNTFKTDGRRANPHLKPNSIYQREGAYRAAGTVIGRTGKKRRTAADFRKVNFKYTLRPLATIPSRVPFHSDFNRIVRREMRKQFDVAMRSAMKTAFKR